MPYQLINSVTGQVRRASRLQLTAIHREAAKKKLASALCPYTWMEMLEKRFQLPTFNFSSVSESFAPTKAASIYSLFRALATRNSSFLGY